MCLKCVDACHFSAWILAFAPPGKLAKAKRVISLYKPSEKCLTLTDFVIIN